MRRFYQVDIRDLWRRDEEGRRRLSLRQVWVYLRHLPPASALAINDNGDQQPWSATDYLIADLWEQQANKGRRRSKRPIRHPARPVSKTRRSAQERQRQEQALRRHRRQYQAHYGM